MALATAHDMKREWRVMSAFNEAFNNVVEQWTTRAPRSFALTNTFKF